MLQALKVLVSGRGLGSCCREGGRTCTASTIMTPPASEWERGSVLCLLLSVCVASGGKAAASCV